MAFLSCQDWSDDHCNDDDDDGGDRSDEPTSTSVLQIPIEHIIFPAVTICPLGESGAGRKQGGKKISCYMFVPSETSKYLPTPLSCTNKIRYLTWFERLISLKAIAKQVQMNVFYQSLAGSRRQSRRPRPSCPWWGTAASPATTRTPAQSATGSRWAANIFTGGRDIFTRANIHRGSIMSTACVWLSTTLTSPSTAPIHRKMWINISILCKNIMCNLQ